MSDSKESGVTYTDISSPFEELSDIGSPRADDHEYLMMLEDPYVQVALQAPPSLDYMPGLEEPEQAPPSPDYVPGPEHDDDEIVAEDQPYAEDASLISQSPEYVPKSDFEMHPKDDDVEDPEEDPVTALQAQVATLQGQQGLARDPTQPELPEEAGVFRCDPIWGCYTIPKTPENSDDEGNGEQDIGLNVGRKKGHDEEEKEDELYRDVNINQGRGIQATLEVEDSHVTLTPVNPDGMESIFETTSQMDAQTLTSVAPLPITAPTMTPFTIATITTTSQAPIPHTTAPSSLIQDLPNFGSLFGFDNRLRTLEATSLNSSQKENDEFLKTIDENMQKIIKEQVKEQVKVQVSKILPRIEQTVNEQLESEVLTRSSHSSKTSYAVAADLSEMELKKIIIEKMEGNKSIQHSDEQTNLYKALVEAYEFDKIILDTYGETVTLKRRRDGDADKDEEPSAGPDQGSKRCREGKEPESASAPMKTATRSAGRSTQGTKSRQASTSESATAEEPMQTTF
nr:hypothetical protein [Tanacetum cinerariifolium]